MFDSSQNSTRSRFRTAVALAVTADALQIFLFPLFAQGAASPLDDVLDFAVAAALVSLTGWHWEYLPSMMAELVPGVDLVPFWTLAIANVYRKRKQTKDVGAVIDVSPLEGKSSTDAAP